MHTYLSKMMGRERYIPNASHSDYFLHHGHPANPHRIRLNHINIFVSQCFLKNMLGGNVLSGGNWCGVRTGDDKLLHYYSKVTLVNYLINLMRRTVDIVRQDILAFIIIEECFAILVFPEIIPRGWL